MNEPWWKRAVVYQIYPKSFNDSNSDGIGDIQGIIEKLDYLKKLGVDVIWLTPIYKSPGRDNGYDISDYFNIDERYGSFKDFKRLLTEAHHRGIKVILDIVVNHTSTEHEWFKSARSSKNSPYRDFYIWKDPAADGSEPNNWQSKFGGSAWAFDEKTSQYYLHLYDISQADLNWENKAVRGKVYDMMRYWLNHGVDGFRLDVINLISKDQRFPNDDGIDALGDGRKFYTDGPRIHEFLQEMNREVFSNDDLMTVGEMSSTAIDECIKYTNPERRELDMVFNFHHLKVDYPNGEKWVAADFDFLALKRILSEWQMKMHQGGGWNALFWCNHDQPRIVSRFGDEGTYWKVSAKMLATAMHMLQGTPYIYQGEEIGMTNPNFSNIDSYRDVESLNMYQILKQEGKPEEEILNILKQKSRDNSRTPMQWNDQEYAGFSNVQPWIEPASNYHDINAEAALEDRDSIFYHYQKLIKLRKKYDIVTYGDYRLLYPDHPRIYAYLRRRQGDALLVINNFFEEETLFHMPADLQIEKSLCSILIANYPDAPNISPKIKLRPYESIVYLVKNTC
ncbi:trehalose-6-phosphate hydrolase [Scopulibacillus daqui]|uniref:Alpha,alpha-phosphotrehalase n=1 Tax=Scopulibacillus daqui TaxID=1469162 RepID=A0ABS2PZT5_9BACL|nr:alpha,alpha-phosphotrehalase [Scopulibacillus daqui]MBM7644959.1 trehalose-6-phosphate hydrolase [Scopulibacillus daqui]